MMKNIDWSLVTLIIMMMMAAFMLSTIWVLGCSVDGEAIESTRRQDNIFIDSEGAAGSFDIQPEVLNEATAGMAGMAGESSWESTGASGEDNIRIESNGGVSGAIAGTGGDGNERTDAAVVDSDPIVGSNDGGDSDPIGDSGTEAGTDAAVEARCDLPYNESGDCHRWQCVEGEAVKVIDSTDEPEWNRDHPLWDTLSTTMPTCSYYGCDNGMLGMRARPECYVDYEVTWGIGVCFYCFQGQAYLFDCSIPNPESLWKVVCP